MRTTACTERVCRLQHYPEVVVNNLQFDGINHCIAKGSQ